MLTFELLFVELLLVLAEIFEKARLLTGLFLKIKNVWQYRFLALSDASWWRCYATGWPCTFRDGGGVGLRIVPATSAFGLGRV